MMGWANPAMLLGLAAVAIPIVIHLLARRRNVVIDWGAMQFLDVGRRARQRIRITDALLLASRMLLIALVALALARPLLQPRLAPAAGGAAPAAGAGAGAAAERRDVVLVLDGASSMGRKVGPSTPDQSARRWAAAFVRQLPAGSTAAVLRARERPRPLVEPLAFDRAKVAEALEKAPAPRGASDLPAALAEALRLLEAGENAARDVVVLGDGRARPWRSDEPARWQLVRDLHAEFRRRTGVEPRFWSVAFDGGGEGEKAQGADGSVGPLELPRGLVPPGLPLTIRTSIANAGPAPLVRTAELLVDGEPVASAAQAVGPVPPGGSTPLEFRVTLDEPGAHLLAVRLAEGDDPLPGNDAAERPVSVVSAVPALLVDGEAGLEPLSGEADFLRAALAPTGDDTPQVVTRVVRPDELTPEAVKDQKVLVLANVAVLPPAGLEAVARLLEAGGGVLVAPGDRVEPAFYDAQLYRAGAGWLPAALRAWHGEAGTRKAVAHPAPASFAGPILAPLGQGREPPLATADLFGYWTLEPATRPPAAAVLARLDTGDPWIVERPYRKGRVVLLAGPVDAEGGTLPVNPDFVPLAHELVFHLADPAGHEPTVRPGEPIVVAVEPAPPETLKAVEVLTPTGQTVSAPVVREAGAARVRLAEAEEPGTYRFALPAGPSYVTVSGAEGESDRTPLDGAARKRLSEGWPLAFAASPAELSQQLAAAGSAARIRPLWRLLVVGALAGLCLEIYLTRRIVRSRGIAEMED